MESGVRKQKVRCKKWEVENGNLDNRKWNLRCGKWEVESGKWKLRGKML